MTLLRIGTVQTHQFCVHMQTKCRPNLCTRKKQKTKKIAALETNSTSKYFFLREYAKKKKKIGSYEAALIVVLRPKLCPYNTRPRSPDNTVSHVCRRSQRLERIKRRLELRVLTISVEAGDVHAVLQVVSNGVQRILHHYDLLRVLYNKEGVLARDFRFAQDKRPTKKKKKQPLQKSVQKILVKKSNSSSARPQYSTEQPTLVRYGTLRQSAT